MLSGEIVNFLVVAVNPFQRTAPSLIIFLQHHSTVLLYCLHIYIFLFCMSFSHKNTCLERVRFRRAPRDVSDYYHTITIQICTSLSSSHEGLITLCTAKGALQRRLIAVCVFYACGLTFHYVVERYHF